MTFIGSWLGQQKGTDMFGLPMHIKGKRDVRLMPFSEDQAREIAQYWREPVTRFLRVNMAQTEESELAWYHSTLNDRQNIIWGIHIFEEGEWRLVGTTNLSLKASNRASTGTVIFRTEFWGQGIISAAHRARTFYACDKCDVLAIDSEVFVQNEASWRALERVGYFRTGTVYCDSVFEGLPTDVYNLMWVNPQEEVWAYFWRGRTPPDIAQAARERAIHTLEVARDTVAYLD